MNEAPVEPADAPTRRAPSHRDPSERGARHAAQRHRRLRYLFFGLASGWGFASGSVAVLAGLDPLGFPTPPSSALSLRLAVAAVVALAGGIVVALAYREVVRRGP